MMNINIHFHITMILSHLVTTSSVVELKWNPLSVLQSALDAHQKDEAATAPVIDNESEQVARVHVASILFDSFLKSANACRHVNA